jgi:hypothetical protein
LTTLITRTTNEQWSSVIVEANVPSLSSTLMNGTHSEADSKRKRPQRPTGSSQKKLLLKAGDMTTGEGAKRSTTSNHDDLDARRPQMLTGQKCSLSRSPSEPEPGPAQPYARPPLASSTDPAHQDAIDTNGENPKTARGHSTASALPRIPSDNPE